MRGRRYTIVIANRASGAVRRVNLSLRPAVATVLGIFAVPVLIGLGARWSAWAEISELRSEKLLLETENGNYRAATGELTTQIQSLDEVISDLGERARLDPEQAQAL